MPMDAEGEEVFTVGHRMTSVTLQVLRPYCVWDSMETDVGLFVKQCLNSMDGEMSVLKPRPLGGWVHSKKVEEVLHCDFLHIETGGALREDGIGGEAVKNAYISWRM